MRSTRTTVVLTLILFVFAGIQAATVSTNQVNHQRQSINVTFSENAFQAASKYHMIAEYNSGDLIFNISTLKDDSAHHHAHIHAVPFYNNSDKSWSSSVHLAQFYANGQQSRILQFDMSKHMKTLNNYGPGPCEKMNPLGTEVVCQFNLSLVNQSVPLFVSIKNADQEQASLKILGTFASNAEESVEFSYVEHTRINNLIKKAELRVLYNEPKSIMELRWNGLMNASAAFKKFKPTKISFQSDKYNTTTAWKGLSTLQPTSYLFFSDYVFSEKDCQVWCNITLILADPESPGSFYPVQILKYRNPASMRNLLIVAGCIAVACLVVFMCWITKKRRSAKRRLAEMSQFTEISKVPATHYVVYHTAQGPQQPYRYPAQTNFTNQFIKK